jgi:hypothetical protein
VLEEHLCRSLDLSAKVSNAAICGGDTRKLYLEQAFRDAGPLERELRTLLLALRASDKSANCKPPEPP